MADTPPNVLRLAAAGLRDHQWAPTPQEHQRPPDGDWRAWVLATGRGGGKSFAAMHWLDTYATDNPGLRARIIAPTFGDAVASCVEGDNGLLTRNPAAHWAPSAAGGARVEYPNGSKVWILGTPTPREVDRLRALTNMHVDVFEEAAANPQLAAAFDQAKLSRRGRRIANRWVATTTPRPLAIMRKWAADPNIHYVRAASSANKYADKSWLDDLDDAYKGTRLYRQEVLGEIIDDVEGALWRLDWLDGSRVHELPADVSGWRFCVAIDPASGSGTTGIILVAIDPETRHVYVIADASVTNGTPEQWAHAAINLAETYDATIVAEDNQGGAMVKSVLNNTGTHLPVRLVRATSNKAMRADPVALLWEKTPTEAHIVGTLPKLEDQLITWTPADKDSPDRLDAMVHGATWLRREATPAKVNRPTRRVGGW